jgi:hypothetical protein
MNSTKTICFFSNMTYRLLLENKTDFESKICGMHANIAQAVRAHLRDTDRSSTFFEPLVERIRDVLHRKVDPNLSVGVMFSSPFANYHSDANFTDNDVIINLLVDEINIDSKMMTFIRKKKNLDSSDSSPIWAVLYRFDCTQ